MRFLLPGHLWLPVGNGHGVLALFCH